jgi:hypothetical protein
MKENEKWDGVLEKLVTSFQYIFHYYKVEHEIAIACC